MPVYGVSVWMMSFLDSQGNPTDAQGMTTEADIDNLTQTFDDDPRAGYAGAVSFAQGFEPMEASFTFKGISEEFLNAIMNSVNGESSIQLNASADDDLSGNSIKYELILRGKIMEYPTGGGFSANETTEFTLGFRVNSWKRNFGASTHSYNPRLQEWLVNGVNKFSARKQALGL